MSKPAIKVELGFGEAAPGDFFTLDDAVRGVLDNTIYVLNSGAWYDVTSYVTDVGISRGRNRELDRFNAGHLDVRFNNRDRSFDPTYTSSPFYGSVVPRKDIRVSVNGALQFVGQTDDWSLEYSPDGNSTASASAYDGFLKLSQQQLAGGTATAQLSGARVNAVLSDSNVQWSATQRNINVGQQMLQADVIKPNQDVSGYIGLIEQSEPGMFFIDKNGYATWLDRAHVPATGSITVLADDGTGVPYTAVHVVYGSELLYNQVTVGRVNGGTATTMNGDSQTAYGVRALSQTNLLMDNDADVANLAQWLVNQYDNPEFRFESVEIMLNDLSPAQQASVLSLEIGDSCNIVFTPNKIGSAITKTCSVLGVSHAIGIDSHKMVLKFKTLENTVFVLDDAVYGLLDLNSLSY
jgi:hypothetical protein